mgnify:FL=1
MYHLTFALSCLYLYGMYKTVDLDPYVMKNVMKSVYLAFLSVLGLLVIFPPYNNNMVKIFASLYVSNDFMGLFMVRLNWTTICHHMVSTLFLCYTWTVDFNTNPTAQHILIYTWISSINFGVNLYLGLRKLDDFEWLKYRVRGIYVLTFCMNIVYQVWNATNPYYWMFLIFIIVDDIYLIKWLYK